MRAPSGVARRKDAAGVGMHSWTDVDIDCLLQRRSLAHFSGDARSQWMHAIRAGVLTTVNDEEHVCDWWGQPDYLIRREHERISIVFAFA